MKSLARAFVWVAFASGVSILGANCASAASRYLLQPLTSLGDEIEMVAAGINNSRQVVGHVVDEQGHSRAAAWTPDGQVRLPDLSGSAPFSQAFRINELGQIVGRAGTAGGRVHATLWDEGAMFDLGTLTGEGDSFAADINDLGVVAGSSTAAVGQSAFTWTASSKGFVDYGNTDPPYRLAVAGFNGINNQGLMVGTSYILLDPFHASFAREGQRGVTDLSPPGRNSVGMALAVNDLGTIVGYQSDENGVIQAAIFSEGGPIEFLGTLGMDESWAQDVNQANVIVGRAFAFGVGELITKAFVWDDGEQHDLLSLVNNPEGWTLIEATAINDDGVIVGNALLNGESRAFMAIPVPEPASAASWMIGLVAIAWWRHRAR